MPCYQFLDFSEFKCDMISLKGQELTSLSGYDNKSTNAAKLDVSNNLLSSMEGIESWLECKWLNASHNQIKSIKHLKTCSKINILNLGNNNISSTKHLNKLKELNALIMNNNELETLDGLTSLKELNTLVVSSNKLKTVDLTALKKLQKFSISRNQLTEFPLIQNQKDIKDLKLNDNKITEIPDWLATSCVRIKILDLGNNCFENLESIECLTKLPYLENLNLRGNPLCNVEDYHLKMKEKFPNLKILDYSKMSELYFKAVDEKSKRDDLLKQKKGSEVIVENSDKHILVTSGDEKKTSSSPLIKNVDNDLEHKKTEVNDIHESTEEEHDKKKKKRKRKNVNIANLCEDNEENNETQPKKLKNVTDKIKSKLNEETKPKYYNVELKKKKRKKRKQTEVNPYKEDSVVKGNEKVDKLDNISTKKDRKIKIGKKKKEETKKTGVVSITAFNTKESLMFDANLLEDKTLSFGVGGSCAWS